MSALDELRQTAWVKLGTIEQTVILADEAGHHEMAHVAADQLAALRERVTKLEWLQAAVAEFEDKCGWNVPVLNDKDDYEIDGYLLNMLVAALKESK